MCLNERTTSSEVIFLPLWKVTSFRRVNVYVVPALSAFHDSASMGTMVSVFATGLPFTTFFSEVTSWSYAAITRVSLVPSFTSAGSRVLPPSECATVREASVFFAAEVLFALVPQAETPRTAARPSATVERIRFVIRCLSCAFLLWGLWGLLWWNRENVVGVPRCAAEGRAHRGGRRPAG